MRAKSYMAVSNISLGKGMKDVRLPQRLPWKPSVLSMRGRWYKRAGRHLPSDHPREGGWDLTTMSESTFQTPPSLSRTSSSSMGYFSAPFERFARDDILGWTTGLTLLGAW